MATQTQTVPIRTPPRRQATRPPIITQDQAKPNVRPYGIEVVPDIQWRDWRLRELRPEIRATYPVFWPPINDTVRANDGAERLEQINHYLGAYPRRLQGFAPRSLRDLPLDYQPTQLQFRPLEDINKRVDSVRIATRPRKLFEETEYDKLPPFWYAETSSDLFARVWDFANDAFGHKCWGDRVNERDWTGYWINKLPADFIRAASVVARGDPLRGRKDGHDEHGYEFLFLEQSNRVQLSTAVIAKLLQENCFDALLFGVTPEQKKALNLVDRTTDATADGYSRKMSRYNLLHQYLTGDLFTDNFWPEVDRVTTRILAVLLPLINLVGDYDERTSLQDEKAQWPSLIEVHQRLHNIVAEAAWLTNGIQLSRSCFWVEFPQPGQLWDVRQEHAIDTNWNASNGIARAPIAQWTAARDAAWQRRPRDNILLNSAWNQDWARQNPKPPNDVRRTAKVQIAMWPFFERYFPHHQNTANGGGANNGDLTNTVHKAQVVYYAGGDADEWEQWEDYTLSQHLLNWKKRGRNLLTRLIIRPFSKSSTAGPRPQPLTPDPPRATNTGGRRGNPTTDPAVTSNSDRTRDTNSSVYVSESNPDVGQGVPTRGGSTSTASRTTNDIPGSTQPGRTGRPERARGQPQVAPGPPTPNRWSHLWIWFWNNPYESVFGLLVLIAALLFLRPTMHAGWQNLRQYDRFSFRLPSKGTILGLNNSAEVARALGQPDEASTITIPRDPNATPPSSNPGAPTTVITTKTSTIGIPEGWCPPSDPTGPCDPDVPNGHAAPEPSGVSSGDAPQPKPDGTHPAASGAPVDADAQPNENPAVISKDPSTRPPSGVPAGDSASTSWQDRVKAWLPGNESRRQKLEEKLAHTRRAESELDSYLKRAIGTLRIVEKPTSQSFFKKLSEVQDRWTGSSKRYQVSTPDSSCGHLDDGGFCVLLHHLMMRSDDPRYHDADWKTPNGVAVDPVRLRNFWQKFTESTNEKFADRAVIDMSQVPWEAPETQAEMDAIKTKLTRVLPFSKWYLSVPPQGVYKAGSAKVQQPAEVKPPAKSRAGGQEPYGSHHTEHIDRSQTSKAVMSTKSTSSGPGGKQSGKVKESQKGSVVEQSGSSERVKSSHGTKITQKSESSARKESGGSSKSAKDSRSADKMIIVDGGRSTRDVYATEVNDQGIKERETRPGTWVTTTFFDLASTCFVPDGSRVAATCYTTVMPEPTPTP